MNSLELINELYKPYRITKLNSCTIIDSTEGKFVVKPKGKRDVKDLHNYLISRNFYEFPKIVDSSRADVNIYEYLEDTNYPKDQKAIDMIKLVASLHSKTVYSKEVREDKYKEIYENIRGNLEYYKDKYSKMVDEIESEIFMSPSHYLFIRNSSKLMSQVKFCEEKLNEWYENVKNSRESRVSVVHNNLGLDHYIKGEKEALISWDNAITDNPILDIYNLYQKEALNIEFKSVLKTYLKNFPLEDDELSLLLILLCMPKDINFLDEEFKSCEKIGKDLDYVYKTEELVRPYYSIENEE